MELFGLDDRVIVMVTTDHDTVIVGSDLDDMMARTEAYNQIAEAELYAISVEDLTEFIRKNAQPVGL